MHNLYLPPKKILLFLLLFFGGGYLGTQIQSDLSTLPKWDFQFPKIDLSFNFDYSFAFSKEDSEITERPELTWSDIPIVTNGTDRKYGNLVGMQVLLRTEDFVKEEWWRERLEEVLEKGKSFQLYDRKTIVIFPEHVGTGLVLLGEKSRFVQAEDWNEALATKGQSFNTSQMFYEKSEQMLDVYQRVFGELAKKYGVPILAGSIILPEPRIERGTILINKTGPLYNVTIPFSAEGKPMEPLVKKSILTNEEKEFLSAGSFNQERVWVVPGWKVGILLGIESLEPGSYERLKERPLDGLVSPSLTWDQQKFGDKNLSARTVWETEGLSRFISLTKAQDLVQVFLLGNWFGKSGKSFGFNLRDFQFQERADSETQPTILNLYF